MKEQATPEGKSSGKGKFRFVLGRGSAGVFGHVELSLQAVPESGRYSVQWQVENDNHAEDARGRVESAVGEYLRKYVAGHPGHGFLVTITEVTSDAERRNDYERAAGRAVRDALEDMGLPVPQIFGL